MVRVLSVCMGNICRSPLVAKVASEGESHLERDAYMLRYLRKKSDLPVPEAYLRGNPLRQAFRASNQKRSAGLRSRHPTL